MTPHNFPQNWQITTIEKSCIIKDNLRIPVSAEERKKRNAIANKLYPYYGATGKAGEIDDYIFDEENVLLGEDGAPFLERKKDKAYLVCGKYWVNNHAHILQGKPNILDNKFLCYQLNIIDYSTYISGTTRLKLNQTQMKKIQIKLPPLEIQREIVEILESKLEKIKEAKTLLETSLQECETYRLSLLESAFSGNLTPHSQDWQWVKLGECLEKMTTAKLDKDTFSYIDIESINNKTQTITIPKTLLTSKAPSRAKREVKEGDTLFSMVRPYLKNIAFVDSDFSHCVASTGFYVCRPKPNILQKYLFFVMISPLVVNGLNHFMRGDNSPSIRSHDLEGFSIPLPPLEIQREIVEILESKLEKIKEAKALLETSLQECETYRLSLLESAFAGELV